jgi:hypothetical protein
MVTLVVGLLIAGLCFAGWYESAASASDAGAAQEATRRWEYKVVEEFDNVRLERELNRLGEAGFEVAEFEIANQAGGAPRKVVILKKPRS